MDYFCLTVAKEGKDINKWFVTEENRPKIPLNGFKIDIKFKNFKK